MWHLHQMIQLQEINQIPHPLKLCSNSLVVVTWEFVNWMNPICTKFNILLILTSRRRGC